MQVFRSFINFLISAYIVLSMLSCSSAAQREKSGAEKPNILYIFTDQQTINAMSCTGNGYLNTPAMDELAATGVRFKQSYCVSPVCGPTRSSIITSRMPHETGYNFNPSPGVKPPIIDFLTMGELFKDAGYRIAWSQELYLPKGYPTGYISDDPFNAGFELLPLYDSTKSFPDRAFGDTTDNYVTNAAVTFIENYVDEKPFLLTVSFCNPHDICHLPTRPDRYPIPQNKVELPPLPMNFEVAPDEPTLIQKKREQTYYGAEVAAAADFTSMDWQNYIYHYYRMTERVDAHIGRILKSLRDKGFEENTLIIFSADHGDGAGSHQWAAKLNLYEEAVKVPFIVSWKGKISPGINQTLINTLDILPTMCDYAGIDIPGSFLGKSLKPVIENPETKLDACFIVTELAIDPKDPTWKGRMIRMNQYKYNLYSKGERSEQLFDLSVDPGEMQNLAGQPDMQAVKESLRNKLISWMEATDDDFLDVWEGS